MKRRILTLALALLLMMIAVAIPTATTRSAQCATGTCETDCYAAQSACRLSAQGRYNYCRNQELRSEHDCSLERGRVYNECMDSQGCKQCIDFRTTQTWFCRCGRYGIPARPGIYVESYDYYEEEEGVPYEYTWDGMGCDTSPEVCDPMLWL